MHCTNLFNIFSLSTVNRLWANRLWYNRIQEKYKLNKKLNSTNGQNPATIAKSRYYKERQVDRKKRKAIRWWFVSIRHGHHVLSQCPKQTKQRHSPPPEILKNAY